MAKNYYAILGVLPTATLDEIRSAYRNRVKQFHPDHFGKDTSPFLNVQEAYDVLGDEVSRRRYDRSRKKSSPEKMSAASPEPLIDRSRRPMPEPMKGPRRYADFGTISPLESFRGFRPSYDEIFDNLLNSLDLRSHSKAESYRTLTMEVPLTAEQARWGGSLRVVIPIQSACPTCRGLGTLDLFECWRCSGKGSTRYELPLHVEYPAGIRDSYRIAIPLDRYGIHNVCPVLLFRITSSSRIEEL